MHCSAASGLQPDHSRFAGGHEAMTMGDVIVAYGLDETAGNLRQSLTRWLSGRRLIDVGAVKPDLLLL
jgi:hypothetical protein